LDVIIMALISLENVSLRYPIYEQKARSAKQLILTRLGGGISIHNNVVVVDALCGINLELHDGDRLGIVGHNGAGKTTLLRVLAQVYEPQCGKVIIKGKVSSFVDITLGMDVEATGWQNIIFRCIFLGLSYKQATELSPFIAEFSELGEFLDMPVRTYSSGMYMRLAFAVTTSIHPDILIMDEMIGAGDASFFDKATERVTSMMGRTKIVVVATHSNFTISRFCNKVLWMEKGKIKALGPVDEILTMFEASTSGVQTENHGE
jgi:ABC-type polysaccharide/polyol phosphate transport system ATPase subunit